MQQEIVYKCLLKYSFWLPEEQGKKSATVPAILNSHKLTIHLDILNQRLKHICLVPFSRWAYSYWPGLFVHWPQPI